MCGLDTTALKRRMKGRGMWAKLCEKGFVRRRSLWELDHIIPLIDEGGHDLSNLQSLCVPCHREKTARESGQRAARRARCQAGQPEIGEAEAQTSRPVIAARDSEPDLLDRELDRLLARVDEANARIAATLERADPRPSGRTARSRGGG